MKTFILIHFLLFVFFPSSSLIWAEERMSIQISNISACISPDKQDMVLHKVDQYNALPVYPDTPSPTQIICIDNEAESPADFLFTFRYEDIPLEKQSWLDSLYISGANLESTVMTRTAYKLGTGDNDFVEFTAKIIGLSPSGTLGTARYYDISNALWTVKFGLDMVARYDIFEAKPSSLNFYWYKLIERMFPVEFSDNGPIPELFYLDSQPIPDAGINIGGFNLIFDSTEAITDSDGVFEVYAFVDPESFASTVTRKTFARTIEEKQAASQSGLLSLEYKKLYRQNKINGYYCEVIQVEGKVTIVEGDGSNVKVGDILYPGTKLSLSSSWGTKAQIGLRFINGKDALVLQDVFTNACITDLIVIGDEGIGNLSVIQGKTALMSVSRWLCEEIAGLPNTPEEWASATGKLAIKTAAGLAVPGSSLGAFAIRYTVKKAVGAGYDAVHDTIMTSGGDYHQRALLREYATGDERVEISTYYDGSMRIAENMTDEMSLYTDEATLPFFVTQSGQWTEITGDGMIGRTFYQTPDSIDQTGPEFKVTYEYNPDLWTHKFMIYANDFSGIDQASFSVLNGGNQITSSFTYQEYDQWVAEFISDSPWSSDANITVSDKIGNQTSLIWNTGKMPTIPINLQVSPGYIYGGSSTIRWQKPDNIDADDVKFYEIRQKWTSILHASWIEEPWLSVGTFNDAKLQLPDFSVPEVVNPSIRYVIEVRACSLEGICGNYAQSQELKPLLYKINFAPIYNLLLF